MSNMPPPVPHRPPRPAAIPSATGLTGSPPRRAAPPARPHAAYMYEYQERRSSSASNTSRVSLRPSSSTSSLRGSSSQLTTASTSSSSSSFSYLSAGFASKARAALSTAGSYVASTATAAAAAASAATERSVDASGKKQTWEEWARDWRDGRRAAIKGEETLYVVPGWAVKRPRKDGGEDAFDLHVSVSGFCNFVRDPGSTSRTQRALVGIAKRFAALPAPPIVQATIAADTLVDEPSETLAFDKLKLDQSRQRDPTPGRTDSKDGLASAADGLQKRKTTAEVFEDPQQLSAAHTFMDLRMRPFWSSVLAYRRVAISMYPVPLKRGDPPPHPDAELFKQEPLVRTTFTTNANGHFSHNVVVPWERICTHPQSLPMAFADDPANDRTDWGIIVRAELLSEEAPNRLRPATGASDAFGPADSLVRARGAGVGSHTSTTRGPPPVPPRPGDSNKSVPYVPRRVQGANSFFSSAEEPNRNDGDGETEMGLMGLGKTMVESWTVVDISRPGGIRVISDLDDTVKHTDILSGPREVFRNVFCRDLSDSCVPGMDDLYAEMNRLGLSGLHFVSNSPFELFPVVAEFLRTHNFPSYYSLKLKFYGGRSIVSSLFEGAGQRKRPSVLEIMDEFYDSRFILIGDSGEQDLELYASIAHERPDQVAAIFIRDVTSRRVNELRRSATDYSDRAAEAAAAGLSGTSSAAPSIRSGRSSPTLGSANGTPPPPARRSTDDDIAQTVDELQQLSAAENKILRRAADWEARVQRAYAEIPPSVSLVFFEDVAEIQSLAKELVRDGVRHDVHPVQHKHSSACHP